MQPQLRYCEYESGEKSASLEELMQMRLKIDADDGIRAELDVSYSLSPLCLALSSALCVRLRVPFR